VACKVLFPEVIIKLAMSFTGLSYPEAEALLLPSGCHRFMGMCTSLIYYDCGLYERMLVHSL
jgi:hypothetical protein